MNYLIPLITIPYLTRSLGPSTWGLVAFIQAFAQYLSLVVDYGFGLSATREVSIHRDQVLHLDRILAGVMGAKLFLTLIALFIAYIVGFLLPNTAKHPYLLWLGVAWGIAQAFNFMWYFQGIERLSFVSLVDAVSKGMGLVAIIMVVRVPEDAWKVLFIQAVSSLVSTGIAGCLVYHVQSFRVPRYSDIREAIVLGWTMFIFKASVSLYTVGNTFILGLFVSTETVGYYAGAEKISRAFIGLMNPVTQALYPRINALVQSSKLRAAALVRKESKVVGLGSLILSIGVILFSPQIIHVMLGRNYNASIAVLQLLSVLVPIVSLSNVLGVQWMLPLGMDKLFNKIILGGGLCNLVMGLTLAPFMSQIGMAVAVVCSEALVTILMYVLLCIKRLDPRSFLNATRPEEDAI